MSAVSPSKYNRIELQKKGKDPVELKGGVVSVDYYESLYSPTVTANVMYMDAGGNLEDDKNKLTSVKEHYQLRVWKIYSSTSRMKLVNLNLSRKMPSRYLKLL